MEIYFPGYLPFQKERVLEYKIYIEIIDFRVPVLYVVMGLKKKLQRFFWITQKYDNILNV